MTATVTLVGDDGSSVAFPCPPGVTVDAEQTDARSKPFHYRLAMTVKGVAADIYCVSAKEQEPNPMIVCLYRSSRSRYVG